MLPNRALLHPPIRYRIPASRHGAPPNGKHSITLRLQSRARIQQHMYWLCTSGRSTSLPPHTQHQLHISWSRTANQGKSYTRYASFQCRSYACSDAAIDTTATLPRYSTYRPSDAAIGTTTSLHRPIAHRTHERTRYPTLQASPHRYSTDKRSDAAIDTTPSPHRSRFHLIHARTRKVTAAKSASVPRYHEI